MGRVDTSVIALWLGHAGIRSTDAYLHADISIKEKALALTTPASARPGRYHPSDKVLAFLESLELCRATIVRSQRPQGHRRSPRHSRGVGIGRSMRTSASVDELGYLPLPAEAASALFQVVNQRYLKSSTIMTTNRSITNGVRP